jgi:hypothetical protein
LQKRYAAIELAYSEQNWTQAESLSGELLAELPEMAGDPLRQRLLLLLGHTRLYGMADTKAARGYYSTVLEQSEEPTLREIAEQGLAQCLELEQPAAGTAQAAANAATPWLQQQADGSGESNRHDPPPAVTGGAAAPWLQKTGGGDSNVAAPIEPATGPAELAGSASSAGELPLETEAAVTIEQAPLAGEVAAPAMELAVEIVEEPEQIAVAQADPQRREELELEEPLVLGAAASDCPEADSRALELVAVGASREEEAIPAAPEQAPLSDALMEEFSRNLLRLRLN